ncbi:MAG: hypothetical protein WA211_03460 [Candidatus Acidiferrales bacterium]
MHTEAAVIQSFESYEWNAEVYGALSAFSRLAVSVQKKANVLALAYAFHKANRQLQSLFDKVHGAMEGKVPVRPNDEPVTEGRLRDTTENLMHMYRTIDYVFEASRRAGLLNNSLSSSALQKMQTHSEELLSLVDWLELAMQKDEVQAIFARAHREKQSGELFDIEQVV